VVLRGGGLYVIGTERHESRRIDNQLRGRSGRQGDPGASKFFLSLEDDLMRIFGTDRMEGVLRRLGLKDGEAIIHPWINKALEKAQQKVEARNFDIRKNLLRYDDVMNGQRKEIYRERIEIMSQDDVSELVGSMRDETIRLVVGRAMPETAYAEQWDIKGLHEEVLRVFGLDLPVADWAKEEGIADTEMRQRISDAVDRKMAEKAANFGPDVMRQIEKSLLLQILDQTWKDHLLVLDHLRQGIVLRAYGQKDPLNEYKREAFNLFERMLVAMRETVTQYLSHVQIRAEEPIPQPVPQRDMIETRNDPALAMAMQDSDEFLEPERLRATGTDGPGISPSMRRRAVDSDPNDPQSWGRVQRNAPCPCGSGKKFKHCHGRVN
jgi:preprotein translocase subunit SecA